MFGLGVVVRVRVRVRARGRVTVCAAPLVSFISPSSRSVHSRCCSEEMAVRHSPWLCSISLMLYLIVCMLFFTALTSSKKLAIAGDWDELPGTPASMSPPALGMPTLSSASRSAHGTDVAKP